MSDSKRFTDDDVRDALRKAVAKSGSQRKTADSIGVSSVYVSKVLNGQTPPGPSVASALGFVEDGARWVRKSKAKA